MIECIKLMNEKSLTGSFGDPEVVTFVVKSNDKWYEYKNIESSPFVVRKFKNMLKRKAFGKAINMMKPFIKDTTKRSSYE